MSDLAEQISVHAEVSPDDQRSRRAWDLLLDDQRERSERRAWQVAWCAAFIAILAVSGIVALAPLRRIVPFLLVMDQARGDIFPIGAVDERIIKDHQELLDKHWVRRYVIARESYYYRLLQEDYDTVYEMSDDEEKERFAAEYDGPNARDQRYGANTEISVRISSIQISSNAVGTQATVRFSTLLRSVGPGQPETTRYHIVTMAYRYQPGKFVPELQAVRNPLGFRVGPYRKSDESPPADTAADKSKPVGI